MINDDMDERHRAWENFLQSIRAAKWEIGINVGMVYIVAWMVLLASFRVSW